MKFGSHLLQFHVKHNLFTNKLPQLEEDTWMVKRTHQRKYLSRRITAFIDQLLAIVLTMNRARGTLSWGVVTYGTEKLKFLKGQQTHSLLCIVLYFRSVVLHYHSKPRQDLNPCHNVLSFNTALRIHE
jgi:hypothetical protein